MVMSQKPILNFRNPRQIASNNSEVSICFNHSTLGFKWENDETWNTGWWFQPLLKNISQLGLLFQIYGNIIHKFLKPPTRIRMIEGDLASGSLLQSYGTWIKTADEKNGICPCLATKIVIYHYNMFNLQRTWVCIL